MTSPIFQLPARPGRPRAWIPHLPCESWATNFSLSSQGRRSERSARGELNNLSGSAKRSGARKWVSRKTYGDYSRLVDQPTAGHVRPLPWATLRNREIESSVSTAESLHLLPVRPYDGLSNGVDSNQRYLLKKKGLPGPSLKAAVVDLSRFETSQTGEFLCALSQSERTLSQAE